MRRAEMIELRSMLLVVAALLAGCEGETAVPDAKQTAAPLTIRNDFHERMLALDDLQRGAALRRAIRASKESCDRVEAAAFQQDHENLKMWIARCQAAAYAVFLAADGGVQVRKCSDVLSLGLPKCDETAMAATTG